jgi:hypothetical protein
MPASGNWKYAMAESGEYTLCMVLNVDTLSVRLDDAR